MPSRKRRTTTKAEAAAEMPVEEVKESRPPVTQVVEVVDEDEAPVHHDPEPADIIEPAHTHEEPSISTQKKEMVDELYAPDPTPAVSPEISMHRRGGAKPIVVWAIITIIVALISGGIIYLVSKPSAMPSVFARPTPTPTPFPTPIATPTPEEIDKTAISIQVLNGGGTPGAAGKMKSLLEEKGWTVDDTGNTDEYTYETTEIHAKESASSALAALEADLKDDYSLGTISADLASDESYDVEVIVGKE